MYQYVRIRVCVCAPCFFLRRVSGTHLVTNLTDDKTRKEMSQGTSEFPNSRTRKNPKLRLRGRRDFPLRIVGWTGQTENVQSLDFEGVNVLTLSKTLPQLWVK